MSAGVAWVRRVAACGALVLALLAGGTQPAAADAAAYNAAMQRGDMVAAWKAAQEVWATWDRTKPATPAIAREFGFAALMAGDVDNAVELASVAVKQGATKATPDEEPWIALVLLRAAEFRQKGTPQRREALREALTARAAKPDYDTISAMGWETLLVGGWSARDWRGVEADAAMAVSFMKQAGSEWAGRVADAEVFGGAAAFFARRNLAERQRNLAYDIMADTHDRITYMIDTETSPAALKRLWKAKWQAQAWTMAIHGYLDSVYEQVGSLVDRTVEGRALRNPVHGEILESAAATPMCEGEWKGPKLVFPEMQAFHGMIGSVIVRLGTDETGKVVKVAELASVPAGDFSRAVAKQVIEWRREPTGSTEGCTLAGDNAIYSVLFLIGGSAH